MKTDLTGQVIGRFTVLREAEQRGVNRYWVCRCECGTVKEVCQGSLKHGKSRSCGCFSKEEISKRETTHGRSRDPIYNIWALMRRRCADPADVNWMNYGGRGIRVCARWDQSFENFLADMGDIPFKGAQIDRKDNDGDYEPSNCRWVTRKENARNTRHNRLLTHDGITLCLTEWDERQGFPYNTVNNRLKLGWSEYRAVTQKPRRTSTRWLKPA